MLDRLSKKLHIIFIGSIMLIITLIIGIICANFIDIAKMNDSLNLQRIATLMIYELEDNDQHIESTIQGYEKNYSLFCTLKDSSGNIVYQSNTIAFPTKTTTLLELLNKEISAMESTNLGAQTATTQDGIFKVEGTSNDNYLGIPAKIFSKSNNEYSLMLIYKQRTSFELLQKQLPFYLLIWIASFIGVVFVSHLLLKKALEPTERILKSQKEFVASASHELKSPLAVILANIEVVDRLSASDMAIQKAVKSIDSECMRMSRLVRDMLLLASSDAKTWNLNKSTVDIDTLLITLYEAYEPLCIKKRLSLNLDISDVSYPVLYTDQERIFQILSIYMDNAINHSKDNSCIQIRTSLTTKTITFYVIDHGNGIKDEEKPFVFDRFYCADKSHTDKAHFGLGLSIADELAKMLNGKVGLKDTDGGGATFFAIFPLK